MKEPTWRPLEFRKFDLTGGAGDDSVYLRRWSLMLFGGWSLKLHLFFRPDKDSCLHDHPWPFWTFVLWGGYEERTERGLEQLRPGALRYRPAKYRHTITRLLKKRAVTLVLCGPKERTWGFWAKHGWVPWREFLSQPGRVFWCKEEKDG